MRILRYLVVGLLAVVALLVIIGFFLPATKHLERDIVIDAPASTIFTLVNGFTRINEWSPWTKIDPATVYTITGPSHGVGAKHAWQSDHPDVGVGSQEITVSTPYERVETYLDFGPQGVATAYFQLQPQDGATHVTWGFDTEFGMNLIGRYFGLMFESMLGPSYEEGLANLKQLAESLPKTDFADLEAENVEVEPQTIAFVGATTSQKNEDIAAALGAAYGQVGAFLAENGLTPVGPPLSINTLWQDDTYAFEAGIPIAEPPAEEVAADSAVQVKSTYGGKALRFVLTGSYEGMPHHYEQIEAYMAASGFEATGPSWNIWVSDPGSTPEEELVTHTFFPMGPQD